MFLDKLKKDNSIISLEMPLYAPVIHLRVNCSSDGCYGCQYGYKVMDTISHSHSIQLFLYSQGKLRVAELRSICHEFELNIFWINTALTFSVT